MKLSKSLTLLLFLSILSFSCSNDDDASGASETNTGSNESSGNYFPNSLNSYWLYDVETTNSESEDVEETTDSLYVETLAEPNFTLGVNGDLPGNGTLNNLLTSGDLTNNLTTLLLNGEFELPEVIGTIDPITLENFIMYDTEAILGTELSIKSETITQDIQGYPLTINITIKTIANGSIDTIDINGTNYSNLVSTNLVISLNASVEIEVLGFPVTLDLLEQQDVLVNTYLFAEDIGLVNSNGEFSYQISATAITALANAGIELPIPASASNTNTQVLTSYSIEE